MGEELDRIHALRGEQDNVRLFEVTAALRNTQGSGGPRVGREEGGVDSYAANFSRQFSSASVMLE